jgi:hypothetical protein
VPPIADLTTLEGLQEVLTWAARHTLQSGVDGTFCPSCGATRHMDLEALYWPGEVAVEHTRRFEFEVAANVPSLFELACVQCHSTIVVLLYRGPADDVGVAAFPRTYGGLSTPKTPPGVAYYLDKARRAQAGGANSAAVAMYRAALEHMLFGHGYTDRMLGRKLEAISADPNAPEWYRSLNPAYLEVLGKLGNAAIHPNDGNVERQATLNRALLAVVRQLFVELLEAAYERQDRDAARLSEMQDALAKFHEAEPSAEADDAAASNDGEAS